MVPIYYYNQMFYSYLRESVSKSQTDISVVGIRPFLKAVETSRGNVKFCTLEKILRALDQLGMIKITQNLTTF